MGVVLVVATTTSNWMPVKRYVPFDIRRVPLGRNEPMPGIGAAVTHQSHAQPGEGAVALAAQFDVLDLAAAVRQRQHVFAARGGPHDRSLQALGQRRNHDLFRVHTGLAAEAPADEWGDHPDVALVHAERASQELVQQVWHLCGAVHDQSPVVVDLGCGAVRLHRRHCDPLIDVAATHDHVGIAEQVFVDRVRGADGDVVAMRLEQQRRAVERALRPP